jgi:hypothetical protein
VIGGAGVIGDYAMAEVVGLLLLRGKNVENGGKRVKKGRQNCLVGNFLEIGLRPKKGRQIFWPPFLYF